MNVAYVRTVIAKIHKYGTRKKGMKYPTIAKKPYFLKLGFKGDGRINFRLKVILKRMYSATKLVSLY